MCVYPLEAVIGQFLLSILRSLDRVESTSGYQIRAASVIYEVRIA